MNFPEAGFAASCRSRRQRQRGAHRSSGRRWEPRGQEGPGPGGGPTLGLGRGGLVPAGLPTTSILAWLELRWFLIWMGSWWGTLVLLWL